MALSIRDLKTLLLAALIFCISLTGLQAETPPFAVIGDTRIGLTEDVYLDFLSATDRKGITLIFHTGDVINRPGSEKEWERFLQLTGTRRSIHIAPGNHDFNNFGSLRTYGKVISKPPYYSFSIEDTQFIILCTELPNETSRVTGKQLAWLAEELQKPFAFRMVFLHRPLFSTPLARGYDLDRHPYERDQLHELFRRSGVSAVFAGHEHLYDRSEKDGVLYIITGGGGAPLITFTEEKGGFFHYIVAKRSDEGYLLTSYDLKGTVRDEFSIKKMR